jgi:hypothetical protein
MHNQAVMNFHKRYLRIVYFTMAICTLLVTKIVFAEQYQLELIIDLSEFNDASTDAVWLDPITSNTDGGEVFVAQDNGLIYLVGNDGTINPNAILNLPLTAEKLAFTALTAMTLHPSFARPGTPEKHGYATFFTAHTTEFDRDKNNNRLTLSETEIVFAFETVITAWTYDFDKQKIDPQSQREVLRIPIKTQDTAIQQLSFDPYQKSWNADYGQLYFSLKYTKELKDNPLYSGVILRIYPLEFGALNFTVPKTNPFVKYPEINNEIVVMGGQNIEQFFWAKSDHASIFIEHDNSEQHWLSKSKVGDDLLTQLKSNFLWQQPTKMPSMLLYQGRDFLSLRNKMVFFTFLDNQWYLTSLAPLSIESPVYEELIARETLSANSNLNVHQDNQYEIIIFDSQQNRLYSLKSANLPVIEKSVSQPNTTPDKSNHYILWISLLVLLLSALAFITRQRKVNKLAIHSIDKDYMRFEYEPKTQNILLFGVNQKYAHKTVILDEIIRCEVLLNNNVVNVVDGQPDNAISNQNEVEIRTLFTKEHSDKMDDEKIRHIEIILSDKDNSYTVCLYLRKGRNRVTGTKYYEAIDILIDLCWVISKRMNPKTTETRAVPSIISNQHKAIVSAPLIKAPQPRRDGDEPTHSRRDDHSVSQASIEEDKPTHSRRDDNVEYSNDVIVMSKVTDTKLESNLKRVASNKETPVGEVEHQSKVVEALEKLASLHRQGHVTDEEFKLAKTKLLQNMLLSSYSSL